jgi:hypothetical protein
MKLGRVLLTISIIEALLASTGSMAQPTKTDSSYFPLRIGNRWSYSSHSTKLTLTIVDTARIQGRLYYQMSIGDTAIPPLYGTWYRCLNDTVFVFVIHNDSSESPLYCLNAKVGDTLQMTPGYECLYGGASIMAGRDDTVSTASATYFKCCHFTYAKTCFDAGMIDSWLAQGIGVVRFREDNIAGARTYILDSSVILTSVAPSPERVPEPSYRLLDSYPNPFNLQTTLTYRIDEGSYVTLTIVDVLGRRIDQLVNEFDKPGTYQVSWNAKDMPSGSYFAVLRTNDISTTRRLVLEK